MRLHIAFGIASVLLFANGLQAQEPVRSVDREVTCASIPGKGFKCSNGYVAADGDKVSGWHKGDPALSGKMAILEITSKLDIDTCYIENRGKSGRFRECMDKTLPLTDFVPLPQERCGEMGAKIAHRKWQDLKNLGWDATMTFECHE